MPLLFYNCYSLQECANSKVTIDTTSVTLVPSPYTQTIDSIVHLIRNKAGEDRGDQSPTMRTTGNNMSNCSIHKTCINTCSKPLFYFMVGQSDNFVATNNMKIEFASIDLSVN